MIVSTIPLVVALSLLFGSVAQADGIKIVPKEGVTAPETVADETVKSLRYFQTEGNGGSLMMFFHDGVLFAVIERDGHAPKVVRVKRTSLGDE